VVVRSQAQLATDRVELRDLRIAQRSVGPLEDRAEYIIVSSSIKPKRSLPRS